MHKLNTIKSGYIGGILFVVFFLICSVWGILLGTAGLKELHLNILQVSFPGFSFSVFGYVIGIAESFIYGWLVGVFLAWLCKKMCVKSCK